MKKNCVTAVKKVVCLGLAASLMWSAPFAIEARADAAVEGFWNTAYDVDYYVEVSAPDGGVNFRSGAGVEYGKILNSMIPNGTELHIEMEARADNGKMWGQTQYQGYWGWVALSQTKKTNGGHTPPAAATAAAETQAQQSYGIGRVVETEPETAAPSYGRHSYSMDGYELKARMYDYVDYDEDEDNERRQPDRLRMSYTAGGESAVTVESVYAWDSIALETERDPGIHGKIEGEAWMADDGLHAEIINGTDVNMADGFLITSYGTAAVKALAPGEKADVILEQKAKTTSDLVEMGKLYRNSLNIYDFITAASAYRPEGVQLSDEEKQERSLLYEMVSNAIDAVRQAQGNGSYRSYESAVFMYCAKPAGIQAPGLKADGVRVERKRDVSLLTASIPFSAVGRTGMVFRSPGMDRPVPVSTDENLMPIEGAFEDDSKQDSYYILSNNPTFLYTLEGMEGAKLSSLRVVLDAWYSEQARVFVLNVEKHAWEEIRLNEDVRNPERYLDEKGRLYVQFRTDSMDMYSDIPTPMISLEGRLENAEN